MRVNAIGEFAQKRIGGMVEDGVNGVQAKRIDAAADPIKGIFDEIAADKIAARTVEIQCITPGRSITRGEIRAEFRQVIAFGAEMVINDVQNQRQPMLVAGPRQPS